MNQFYNIYTNLKKLTKNNYVLIFYDLNKIKSIFFNIIKKNFLLKIKFLNFKVLKYFRLFEKKTYFVFIIKNNFEILVNLIIFVFNILIIRPNFLLSKNSFIKKIPIKEISNLSKKNLFLEILKFLKNKINKLIFVLKEYAKRIS
ncbi:hypothetical protein [Candidatus Carsonella ruddii]|uniref:Ribosomal protein L10 n=1 Tax=Candidatus Carsonella ruddii (Diaphorina cf. continua) TaxID=2661587 RepID=A0A7R6VYF8_CARRU|nr:hypothetical protein [Candidatus Carsonella ruddii (Diaphorina cf. continua)]BCG49403.1 hypothetical protein CRDco_1770 [Candidatus Carsonella ruddii (Diaphorina cf. continua)]